MASKAKYSKSPKSEPASAASSDVVEEEFDITKASADDLKKAARSEFRKSQNEKKEKQDNLQRIIDKRKENRQAWDKDRREKYESVMSGLLAAQKEIVEEMETIIMKSIFEQLKKDPNKKQFQIWNPQNSLSSKRYPTNPEPTPDGEKKNFSVNTLIRGGFWNQEKETHENMTLREAGINMKPQQEVANAIREKGFSMREITDQKLSNNIVLEVTLIESTSKKSSGGSKPPSRFSTPK